MKALLLIVFLLLGGLPTIYARFKRVMEEDGTPQEGGESQSYGSAEAEDDFFDFDRVEAEDAAPAQPAYFTYEAPEVETSVTSMPVMQPVVENEQPTAASFDLRQAVIYQTLLNNRYINQEK